MKNLFTSLSLIIISLLVTILMPASIAHAHICKPLSTVVPPSCSTCGCSNLIGNCQKGCVCTSDKETGSPDKPNTTIGHITDEFKKHRTWVTGLFFLDTKENNQAGLLAAMKAMTTQMNAMAMWQVQAIGTFFDAKHQLETQRLFQQLTAQAHKDYQPSEELCEIGTMSRSLQSSNLQSDLTQKTLVRRMLDRTAMTKNSSAYRAQESDNKTRLINFIENYCTPTDNNKNLSLLCKKGKTKPENANKDINYTQTIDSALTLDINLSSATPPTVDEAAVMALGQNLFANRVFPFNSKNAFVNPDNTPNFEASAKIYMDVRSYLAKQSVAMHSYASIASLKAKGEQGAQPFLYALLKEMGGNNISIQDIRNEIGDNPSYFAQMDILTKKLYQRPEFYSDLYDKPANVMRKNVAMQAATLMQKRDLYDSYLRSEMTLAVMLETLLMQEQTNLSNEMRIMK